jgi:3-hydroxyisobutyrate dehydrogenase-like beta-hydroxyacid dehydrogenase
MDSTEHEMNRRISRVGFIGLGVMGEPICRNLATKSGLHVIAHDQDPAPLQRLEACEVSDGGSVRGVTQSSDIVFLSLPSGEIVHELAHQRQGLLDTVTRGQIVVDLSTSPVDVTRGLAREFAARGASFVDAPVARTRAAAEAGTLSVMVGAEPELFSTIRDLLATFASDVTLCGPVGCGQVVKILNNMILFESVVAIAEAKAIGERAGVDATLLFDTLSKGSADSFALRNHGMKAVLADDFPDRAFSVEYARKDLRYALQLAQEMHVEALGAQTVETWFGRAIAAGEGQRYHPVISRLIGKPDGGA